MRIPLGQPRGRRVVLTLASVALAALTTYLLLDRNHAEELGSGARIAVDLATDIVRAEQLLPLVLVLALVGVAACVRAVPAAVGIGARRR